MKNSTLNSYTPSPEGSEEQEPELNAPPSDVTEMMHDIETTVDRQRRDAVSNDPEFFPLETHLAPSTPIPREAYGMLEDWAQAVSTLSRAPIEMCLVLALATVNMALQAHVDVDFFGRRLPISLFSVGIGPSGSGKSSAFDRFMRPFNDALNRRRAEIKAKEGSTSAEGDQDHRESELSPVPYTTDTTMAALRSILSDCRGSLGLVTDEAASFVGGHAMQSTNLLETIGLLCQLHEAAPLLANRVTTGRAIITGKRLCFLLLGQWEVMSNLFENTLMRQQGFLSRILPCYPDSVGGVRPASDPRVVKQALSVLREYNESMGKWLDMPLPLREGTTNELLPPCLHLSKKAWVEFHAYDHEIQELMCRFGPNSPQRDLVNKSPSLALRIAATLQLAHGGSRETLQSMYVRDGVNIARYHRQEIIRLYTPVRQSPHLVPAQVLLKYLKDKGLTSFSCSQLSKQGPHSLRTKNAHDPVIDFLVRNGWLISTEEPVPKRGGRKKTVYHLTSGALRELQMH